MPETFKILLRLPVELHRELKEWAEEEDRTVTNLIVHLLRRALREWRT